MIRKVKLSDAKAIMEIYNYYVLHTIVTFDDAPFTVDEFKERIQTVSAMYPFIVFEESKKLLGYAYANKWREKPAYKNTVEITIYIHPEAHGKQIGSRLYAELLSQLKNEHYHVIVGGLTLPNEASVKLHEKFGFKQVAHFKEVGNKFGKWLDVGFWQLTLH